MGTLFLNSPAGWDTVNKLSKVHNAEPIVIDNKDAWKDMPLPPKNIP